MLFISHRGNIDKKISSEENNPDKILYCLSFGYDIEIDVWNIKNKFFLGHDEPQYEIQLEFLQNNKLWCHAKNLNALESMLLYNIHCFWHEADKVTVTSKKIIWTYPGYQLTKNSVAVLPENTEYSLDQLKNIYGVCSDKIAFYRQHLGE